MKNPTRNILLFLIKLSFIVVRLIVIIIVVAYLLAVIVLNAVSLSNNQNNSRRASNYSKEATKFIAVHEALGITKIPIGRVVFPYLIKPQQARFITYDAHGNITKETFTETIRNATYDHDKHLIYYESLDGFSVFDYRQQKVIKTVKYPYDERYFPDKITTRSIIDRSVVHNGEFYFSQAEDLNGNAVYRFCQATTKKCSDIDGKLDHLVSTPAGIVAVSQKTVWLFDHHLNLLKREKLDETTRVYGVIADSQSYRLIVNNKIANLPSIVLSRELVEEYQYNPSVWLRISFVAHNQQVYMIVSKGHEQQKAGSLTAMYVADISGDNRAQFKLVWKKDNVYHTSDMVMSNNQKLMFEIQYGDAYTEMTRHFITYEFAKQQVQEITTKFNPINQQPIGSKFWMLD